MGTLDENSITDRIYLDAIEAARGKMRSKQSSAETVDKTSAPKDSELEKLSQVHQRNADLRRLGEIVEQIGVFGFEKAAMSKEGPLSQGADIPTSSITSVTDSSDSLQPKKAVADRGGPGPDTLTSPAGPESVGVSAGDPTHPAQGEAGDGPSDISTPDVMLGDKESASKAAHILSIIAGEKFVQGDAARQKVSSLGVNTSLDALRILKRSADVRGMTFHEFLQGAEFDSHRKLSSMRDLALRGARLKGSEEALDSEVATAKNTVEAVVKSTGTLPTSDEVSRAAGVDRMASNIALYEVGELIAAVGGDVGATAAPPQIPGMPVPGMAGAVPGGAPPMMPSAPMGMGGAAPPPQMPVAPPQPPPPMPPMDDGTGGGAAAPEGGTPLPPGPPGEGGMVATSSAPVPTLEGVRAILRSWSKSSEEIVEPVEESKEDPSKPGTSEGMADPSGGEAAPPASADSFTLSPSQRAEVDAALGSAKANAEFTQRDAQEMKEDGVREQFRTPLASPSKKDLVTVGGAEPKGTLEGRPEVSTEFEGKMSSDAVFSRTAEAVSAELSRLLGKESSVYMHDNHGNISGAGGSGGGPSDTMTGTAKKAVSFVKKHIKEESSVPSVEDVVDECGCDIHTAKTAIAKAVEE